jgi:hypothetical protein
MLRLADPRLTGMTSTELERLAATLAPAQAARALQRHRQQRGGRARRATGNLPSKPLLDDAASLLVTLLYQRQVAVDDPGGGDDLAVGGHGQRRGGRVAFEVDGVEEATRTGWSVLVRGEAVEVTDPAGLARVRKLALYPWAPGAKARYVRILPTVLTGRRIALPEDAPWTWWG